MPITIDGSGSITGISAGGLPDASITTAEIADGNITPTKLSGAQSGSAPIYGARAWVNFDGTRDSTGAVSTANTNRFIRASGNVTSVLRNGTGDYTVNFTTAMPDADYAVVANTGDQGPIIFNAHSSTAQTASVVRLKAITTAGGAADTTQNSVAIFR